MPPENRVAAPVVERLNKAKKALRECEEAAEGFAREQNELIELAAVAAKNAVVSTLRKANMTHEEASRAAYYAVVEVGRQYAIAKSKGAS